jgi:arylsulfatase A-like enzyme
MITGPGFMGGGEVRRLFSTVDVAPTLLDAAAIAVPGSMTGRSILPVIRDGRAPWRDEVFIQISESQTGRALRTQRWKYSVTADYDEGRSSADIYREDFLYDLDNDPCELVNLAGMPTFRGVANDMKARLLRWIGDVEGTRPAITDAAETEPLQLIPAKGDGIPADRLAIDPYKSALLHF